MNLGRSGLRVSRVCLGMMSYGRHESREWAIDEAAAEPIVRRAVEGVERVFHVAADYRLGASHPQEIYDSNVTGTRNLLEAASQAGVRRIIVTSRVVLGVPGEHTPWKQGGTGALTPATPVTLTWTLDGSQPPLSV